VESEHTDEDKHQLMNPKDADEYTVVWDYNGKPDQEKYCYQILQVMEGGAVYEGPIAQMKEMIKKDEGTYMDPIWDYVRYQNKHPIYYEEERRKRRDITTRAMNQWMVLSTEEADMARERTLQQYEPFDEKWVWHNDKHKTHCIPTMVYDRQTEWHLYCMMKDTEKRGWKDNIHQ
jgi:hypothetical protein